MGKPVRGRFTVFFHSGMGIYGLDRTEGVRITTSRQGAIDGRDNGAAALGSEEPHQ
jgi:hypothetical protein